MKILVKFPSRERPNKLIGVLKGYVEKSAYPADIHYLITLDSDDATMTADVLKEIQSISPNITTIHGSSTDKIHAINRGMDQYKEDWDIVVLASDDMVCSFNHWDHVIKTEMQKNFPDTDGALWFWDGDEATRRNGLCTMNIMGRKYYDRFGYLYHPSYKSLWCDNEFTEVGLQLNKLKYSDLVLFRHVHFSNTQGINPDRLMQHTQSYFLRDKENYFKRKMVNFGIQKNYN